MSSQLNAKKRVKYAPEQMSRAIEAVRSGSLSKKAAAKTYCVPRTTLLDKLAGRVPDVSVSIGRKPVLSRDEEDSLVEYTKLMYQIGYPVTRREFLREVKFVLDIDGRQTPFKENLPGHHWFELFCKRNPSMSLRTPMGLGQERARVNLNMINGWFDGVISYLQKEVPDYDQLLKNPRRIFNADESGFPLCAKPSRVLAPKGVHNVYQVVTNTKIQITVMAAFNAYGDYVPPLILFPGERLRDVGLSGFADARYATTKSGWMDSDTFVAFLEMLVKYTNDQGIEFPIILFVDGHSTHMSLAAAEYCRENNVILYCLLPNATHLLQACDIGFFSPMKKIWQQTVKDWQVKNIGVAMGKKDFPSLFKVTWDRVATFENAVHGFRKSGLFPFTSKGVDVSKLGPSTLEKQSDTSTSELEKQGSATENNNGEGRSSTQTTSAQILTSETMPSTSTPLFEGSNTTAEKSTVSSAFQHLRVPEPVEKKKVQRIGDRLPKAISGTAAIQMLKEKEEKRKAEEVAKIQRKEQRARKKLLLEEEKAKRQADKENKRLERENAKLKKKETSKARKRKRNIKGQLEEDSDGSSDSAFDTSALVEDDDSSAFEEEFDMCPACNKGDQHPSMWVKCLDCATRWHFRCANRPEFELLDAAERKKIDFVCPLCI